MPLKAFISYSSQDRLLASQVKDYLAEWNVDAFLAHEDIAVSQEWRSRILEELDETRIFIPLLSAAFRDSDWTSQEMGYALARSAFIIPLLVDGTTPFGFAAAIQGRRVPPSGDYYAVLIEPILRNQPHAIFPALIERLSHAGSFRNAETLMQPLVPLFPAFNDEEIEAFVDACSGNGQVWDASACKKVYIPQFIQMHRDRIPPAKLEILSRLLET